MKIKKDSVYKIKLSGHQIKLIQGMIISADIQEYFNSEGQVRARVLYKSLEEDVVEI